MQTKSLNRAVLALLAALGACQPALAGAEDADTINGVAKIELSATGLDKKIVTVNEVDNTTRQRS